MASFLHGKIAKFCMLRVLCKHRCNLDILSLEIYQIDYYCYLKWNMTRYLSNAVLTIKLFCLYFAFVLKIVLPICKKVKVNVEKMLVDNNLHMKM